MPVSVQDGGLRQELYLRYRVEYKDLAGETKEAQGSQVLGKKSTWEFKSKGGCGGVDSKPKLSTSPFSVPAFHLCGMKPKV